MSDDFYGTTFRVRKGNNLSYVEQAIEHHFADYLERNLEEAVRIYKETNGKILDTDRVRKLSSVWRLSNLSRAVCSRAVHQPASTLINKLFTEALASEEEGAVFFTAGGGGSGKSLAVEQFLPDVAKDALLIYDATLSDNESAVRKVDLVLENHRDVFIAYVYRPFASAARGVLQRSKELGRIVPMDILAHDHYHCPLSIRTIIERYRKDGRVKVYVIDNTEEGPGKMQLVSQEDRLAFWAMFRIIQVWADL